MATNLPGSRRQQDLELRQQIFRSLQENGFSAWLKTQFRSRLAQDLKSNYQQTETESKYLALQRSSLRCIVANGLVLDHLHAFKYEFTHSLFLSECSDKAVAVKDLMNYLHISERSPLYKKMVQHKHGVLAGLLEGLGQHITLSPPPSQSTATQTDHVDLSIVPIAQRLTDIEVEFSSCHNPGWSNEISISVDERLSAHQRECEEWARKQIHLEVQRIREVELTQVRLSEQEKYQKQLSSIQQQLHADYRQKVESLNKLESSLYAKMRQKEEETETSVYLQRQALLKEIDVVRSQEEDLRKYAAVYKQSEDSRVKNLLDEIKRKENGMKEVKEDWWKQIESTNMQMQVDGDKIAQSQVKTIAMLEKGLEESTQAKRSKDERILQLESELRQWKKECSSLGDSVSALTSAQVDLQRRNDSLQQTIKSESSQSRQHKVSELEKEGEVLRGQLDCLTVEAEQKNADFKAKSEDLMANVSSKESEIVELNNRAHREAAKTSKHVEQLQQERDGFEKAVDLLTERLDSVHFVVSENDILIQRLYREAQDLRGHVKVLERAVKSYLRKDTSLSAPKPSHSALRRQGTEDRVSFPIQTRSNRGMLSFAHLSRENVSGFENSRDVVMNVKSTSGSQKTTSVRDREESKKVLRFADSVVSHCLSPFSVGQTFAGPSHSSSHPSSHPSSHWTDVTDAQFAETEAIYQRLRQVAKDLEHSYSRMTESDLTQQPSDSSFLSSQTARGTTAVEGFTLVSNSSLQWDCNAISTSVQSSQHINPTSPQLASQKSNPAAPSSIPAHCRTTSDQYPRPEAHNISAAAFSGVSVHPCTVLDHNRSSLAGPLVQAVHSSLTSQYTGTNSSVATASKSVLDRYNMSATSSQSVNQAEPQPHHLQLSEHQKVTSETNEVSMALSLQSVHGVTGFVSTCNHLPFDEFKDLPTATTSKLDLQSEQAVLSQSTSQVFNSSHLQPRHLPSGTVHVASQETENLSSTMLFSRQPASSQPMQPQSSTRRVTSTTQSQLNDNPGQIVTLQPLKQASALGCGTDFTPSQLFFTPQPMTTAVQPVTTVQPVTQPVSTVQPVTTTAQPVTSVPTVHLLEPIPSTTVQSAEIEQAHSFSSFATPAPDHEGSTDTQVVEEINRIESEEQKEVGKGLGHSKEQKSFSFQRISSTMQSPAYLNYGVRMLPQAPQQIPHQDEPLQLASTGQVVLEHPLTYPPSKNHFGVSQMESSVRQSSSQHSPCSGDQLLSSTAKSQPIRMTLANTPKIGEARKRINLPLDSLWQRNDLSPSQPQDRLLSEKMFVITESASSDEDDWGKKRTIKLQEQERKQEQAAHFIDQQKSKLINEQKKNQFNTPVGNITEIKDASLLVGAYRSDSVSSKGEEQSPSDVNCIKNVDPALKKYIRIVLNERASKKEATPSSPTTTATAAAGDEQLQPTPALDMASGSNKIDRADQFGIPLPSNNSYSFGNDSGDFSFEDW